MGDEKKPVNQKKLSVIKGLAIIAIGWVGYFLFSKKIQGQPKRGQQVSPGKPHPMEEIRSRIKELEILNEVSTAMSIAQKIEAILPFALDKTMTMVNAISGSIWLYHPSERSIQPAVTRGGPALDISLQPGEGIAGTVFATGKAHFTLDIREDPLTHSSARPYLPARMSGACFPIRTAQAVVGVLFIGIHNQPQLTEAQIHLLTTISEIVGGAIHRVQLQEQMMVQLQRLSALHTIDLAITGNLDLELTLHVLLDQAIALLKVDAACVLVFNSSTQTLDYAASRGFITDALQHTHLLLGEGNAGLAAQEQRTIHIPDLHISETTFSRSPSFPAEGFINYYAIPLLAKSQVQGVLEVFHRSSVVQDREWLDFLEAMASQAAIAVEIASLVKDLQRSILELNLAYTSTLEGWSRALDLRDQDTEGHTQRVAETTLDLARALSVSEADLVHLRRGALLHDIGKLGIPDRILFKQGPLTDEEWAVMRRHPMYAYELLSPIAYLAPALDIPYCHHEKWDGSGYPRGLKGEQIPRAARIFAVVDVWDALRSDRPYRKGWPEAKVRKFLQDEAGKHFDPKIVETFLSWLAK